MMVDEWCRNVDDKYRVSLKGKVLFLCTPHSIHPLSNVTP